MTAPTVQIRPMTAADLPRVLEITASLQGAPRWAEAAWLRALDAGARPRRIVLVAVEAAVEATAEAAAESNASAPLGFAMASLLPPQAELETIAVAQENQRSGIGRTLMNALAAQLSQPGIAELWLEVRASNHAALALYRAAGFANTGRRPNYYRNPAEDALLLTLAMGSPRP